MAVRTKPTLNRKAMRAYQVPDMAANYRDSKEVRKLLAECTGQIKQQMSVCLNASYMVLRNCYDTVRQHPSYNRKFSKSRGLFDKVMKDWQKFENQLKYDRQNPFFRLDDLLPEYRKKYGNITDAEYFEYWQGVGYAAYDLSKNFISSLEHKYLKSLEYHEVPDAPFYARMLTTCVVLHLCVDIFESELQVICEYVQFPRTIIYPVFKTFDIAPIWQTFEQAVRSLDCDVFTFPLTETEVKNINLGCTDIIKLWADAHFINRCYMKATEDYSEVFRTKGEQKKLLRSIAEHNANNS